MIPACAVCGETRFELHEHSESGQPLCEKHYVTVSSNNVVPLHRQRGADPLHERHADPRGDPTTVTAALLTSILAFITRFIVLSSEAQARAIALWIAHTHAIDAAEATLYLAVVSAEKRSGKSRLLELLDKLVARGRHTPNISEAALYRVLETVKPTLLVDEVDALFKSGSERTEALRGILNAGNRRGAVVYRCEGPKSETKEFEVFGAKVLAGIDNGALPDTIRDRSLILRLRRKTTDDSVERLLWQDVRGDADALRDRIAEWADQVINELQAARPALPDELDDRAAEGWWPLFAIADHAGGEWPAAARLAAVELSAGGDAEEESRGVRLLGDIRDVFGQRPAMFTEEILTRLNALDESPWGAWHDGGGMASRDLARLLKPYELRSKTVRHGDKTAKGFRRVDLEDAWSRYLAQPSHPSHGSHPASGAKRDVTDVTDVTHPEGWVA